MESCEFCSEFRQGYFGIQGIENRVLYETDHFLVFPGLGQIVEGYLLIASRDHFMNMGAVPPEMYPELESVESKVRDVLERTYGKSLVFEHGPISPSKRGGCCIDHSHLHAVPIHINLIQEIAQNFSQRTIYSFDELKKQFESGIPYFFVEDHERRRYLFDIMDSVPSQYLRRIIASKIGRAERWDWGAFPEFDEMKRTIERLRKEF